MANKKKLMGMLALVLVFGMMVVGCSDPADAGKTIKITGFSGDFLKASEYGVEVWENAKIIAHGDGRLSGSTVTYDLYNVTFYSNADWHTESTRWTGSGTFTLGITATIGEDWHVAFVDDIVIDKAVTTIQASQIGQW